MKRLLVCGGRDYRDWARLCQELDAEKPDLIIEGGATGADAMAGRYAAERGIPLIVMPAPWGTGRDAGFRRNGWMLTFAHPTHVLAFPGGNGTEDMVQKTQAAGVPLRRVS